MMDLTEEEVSMLDGEHGTGVQKAMEILNVLGKIYNAERMVEIKSAQVSGVSYKNLGDAGLEFLGDLAGKGARVRITTTLNPAGMDLRDWKRMGISREFAEKQLRVIGTFRRMGVEITCTCTPYLAGNLPEYGEHIAWSESSAVSYANSVIGARTNRESGISALAAAMTGRTPSYGYHLDENRLANCVIDVRCSLKNTADFCSLGYIIGKRIGNRIPYFRGIKKASNDQLKALGAAMAASGAIALYHIEGITPEAIRSDMISENPEEIVIDSLKDGYGALNSGVEKIDLVAIGCPHVSLEEIQRIVNLIDNRKLKTELWVMTSRNVEGLAAKDGLVEKIENSGARIISDTCIIVAPVEDLGFKTIATNSGKTAFYAPSYCNVKVRFGSLEKCIRAALTGVWIE